MAKPHKRLRFDIADGRGRFSARIDSSSPAERPASAHPKEMYA